MAPIGPTITPPPAFREECPLAFASCSMLYVVIEELIPEASAGEHSNVSTIGFAIGFVLMMILDVVLGS